MKRRTGPAPESGLRKSRQLSLTYKEEGRAVGEREEEGRKGKKGRKRKEGGKKERRGRGGREEGQGGQGRTGQDREGAREREKARRERVEGKPRDLSSSRRWGFPKITDETSESTSRGGKEKKRHRPPAAFSNLGRTERPGAADWAPAGRGSGPGLGSVQRQRKLAVIQPGASSTQKQPVFLPL